MTLEPFDIVSATRREFAAYLAGRVDGLIEGGALGYARGWQACDEEIAALQRAAHRVTQAVAQLDPWPVAQQKRRGRQVEAADRHAQAAQPWPAEATS